MLQEGMLVRVRDDAPGKEDWNSKGGMDYLIGQELVVGQVKISRGGREFFRVLDKGGHREWLVYEDMVEEVAQSIVAPSSALW